MGHFDVLCQASGLSTLGEQVEALFVVERDDGRLSPLTIPIAGAYNRLGFLDGIPRHVGDGPLYDTAFEAIQEAIRAGRIVVHSPYEDERTFEAYRADAIRPSRVHGFEWLAALAVGEQLGRGASISFEGQPIRVNLAIGAMVDAAVRTVIGAPRDFGLFDLSLSSVDDVEVFEALFGDDDSLAALNRPLLRLSACDPLVRTLALSAFLRWRGTLGQPMECEQHTEADRRAIAEAAAPRMLAMGHFRTAFMEHCPGSLPPDLPLSWDELPLRIRASLVLSVAERMLWCFDALDRERLLGSSPARSAPHVSRLRERVEELLTSLWWSIDGSADDLSQQATLDRFGGVSLQPDAHRMWLQRLMTKAPDHPGVRAAEAITQGVLPLLEDIEAPPPDEPITITALADTLTIILSDLTFRTEVGPASAQVVAVERDEGQVALLLQAVQWEADEDTGTRRVAEIIEQSHRLPERPRASRRALWWALASTAEQTHERPASDVHELLGRLSAALGRSAHG